MKTTKTKTERDTTTKSEVTKMNNTLNAQTTEATEATEATVNFALVQNIDTETALSANRFILENPTDTATERNNIIAVNNGMTEKTMLTALKSGTPAQKAVYTELKSIMTEYEQAFKHYGMFACKIATLFITDEFSKISKTYATSNRKGEMFCEFIENYIGISRSTTKRAIRIGLTFLDTATLECNPLIYKLTSAQTRVLSGATQKELDRISKAVEDGKITEDTTTDEIKAIADGKTVVTVSSDTVPSKTITSIGDSRKIDVDNSNYDNFVTAFKKFMSDNHSNFDTELAILLQSELINKNQQAFKGLKLLGATLITLDKITYINMIVATAKSVKAITFTIDTK